MVSTRSKPPKEPPQRIVVVQTKFIREVIFTSPLVHAIKESFPQTSISLLVRPKAKEVAKCIPGVEQVLTFDQQGAESGPLGILRAARRIRRQHCNMLVSPHRSFRTALLALLTKIPVRVGYRGRLGRLAYNVSVRPKSDEPCILVRDLDLLKKVGIPSAGTRLRLKGPADLRPYVEKFYQRNELSDDAKLVGLCIGAYWPTKRWPAIYFASLGESLRERGYYPVLFGGPEERIIAAEIKEVLKEPLIGCVGNTLVESAALIERCWMAVGGDSGLTHMARALGVPTVIIYGPTDHRAHSFGEKTKVLTAKVKCRPCSRDGQRRCPERHHDCMRLVSPEQVFDALKEIANLHTPVPLIEKKTDLNRADATPPPY